MTDKIRPIDIIICDDIRNEIGNKISLQGIYMDKIIVPTIPFLFPKLCFFAKFSGCSGQYSLNCFVNLPGRKKRHILQDGKIDAKKGRKLILHMAIIGLKIEKIGKYGVTIILSQNEKEKTFKHPFEILKATS